MPYKVTKVKGKGHQVTTPGHPSGFSKKPMTAKEAYAQQAAIQHSTGEDQSGKKSNQHIKDWGKKVNGKKGSVRK